MAPDGETLEGAASVDAPGATPGPTTGAADSPEFEAMPESARPNTAGSSAPASMDRFLDVHVPVWAELGRAEMPLGELVRLDEGAVVRLDRPVGEPVDLISQGVKLARGEVIVIDDCFAIRITEIDETPNPPS